MLNGNWTKGEWRIMPYTRRDGDNIRWVKAVRGKRRLAICQTFKPCAEANARLIAAAPPVNILLSLLALGEARFEHSKTTGLIEFCWQGLRYACSDCDWAGLVKTISYEKIEAALAKAKKVKE